jgi:DNA-directed RNA polymerase subunit M/transcription elongation factor TFIIS
MTCPQCGSEMYPVYFGEGEPYEVVRCPECGDAERVEAVG